MSARTIMRQGEYAKLIRAAMRKTIDRKTAEPLKLRGLQRLLEEKGTPYSYEHLRKLASGEPIQSEDMNEAICDVLGLDSDRMWNLAKSEKAIRRFGSLPVRIAAPENRRMREIWDQLDDDNHEKMLKIAEGLLAQQSVLDH